MRLAATPTDAAWGSRLAPLDCWTRPEVSPGTKYRLLALLPVRDRQALLPACLDSLRGAVDGVVALDDGSEDHTPRILREDPLVVRILHRQRRDLAEWDDAANRYLLHQAVSHFCPEWTLVIDSDEELEGSFRDHRETLLGAPASVRAYAFPLVSTDGERISAPIHLPRMYRYVGDAPFAQRRLHGLPIPLSVLEQETRLLSIRFFHHSGTDRQRRERFEKYRVADPHREFQDSYDNLLRPKTVHPLLPPEPELRMDDYWIENAHRPRFFTGDEDGPTRNDRSRHGDRFREAVALLGEVMIERVVLKERIERRRYRVVHVDVPSLSWEVEPELAWLVEHFRIVRRPDELAAAFTRTWRSAVAEAGETLLLFLHEGLERGLFAHGVRRLFRDDACRGTK
ncbi:hypothetical protein Pan216_48630 [Planctomycetes bacterium Pan216]|uniref:Glycosyltransferase 2-like domain-containing protein n=2 Tax=Kolteria novifilia TaxID=2527975 RepID=A0A518BAH1_9BACT|nr:hypothetical protein Pan216_48630 [Planctomycetes bacterium Pan216]